MCLLACCCCASGALRVDTWLAGMFVDNTYFPALHASCCCRSHNCFRRASESQCALRKGLGILSAKQALTAMCGGAGADAKAVAGGYRGLAQAVDARLAAAQVDADQPLSQMCCRMGFGCTKL